MQVRALEIRERVLEPENLEIATSLNLLAEVYRLKGDFARAESMNQRALHIRERAQGPDHLDVGTTLINLALVYFDKGDYAQAEADDNAALASAIALNAAMAAAQMAADAIAAAMSKQMGTDQPMISPNGTPGMILNGAANVVIAAEEFLLIVSNQSGSLVSQPGCVRSSTSICGMVNGSANNAGPMG